jgi:hypothetical protein
MLTYAGDDGCEKGAYRLSLDLKQAWPGSAGILMRPAWRYARRTPSLLCRAACKTDPYWRFAGPDLALNAERTESASLC